MENSQKRWTMKCLPSWFLGFFSRGMSHGTLICQNVPNKSNLLNLKTRNSIVRKSQTVLYFFIKKIQFFKLLIFFCFYHGHTPGEFPWDSPASAFPLGTCRGVPSNLPWWHVTSDIHSWKFEQEINFFPVYGKWNKNSTTDGLYKIFWEEEK